MSNTIESLSTELRCELFEFFNAIELHHIFGDLNSRITSIIMEITPLYFDIVTIKDYNLVSDIIFPKVRNYSNVRSIKFYYEYQFDDFFIRWPISKFQQLHSLSLFYLGDLGSDCSFVFLEQLSQLTSLESLRIRVGQTASYDRYLNHLLQLLFVEYQVFLSVTQFVFQCMDVSRLVHIPSPTIMKQTNLQLISFPSISLENFLEILPSISHIKSMKMSRLYSNVDQIMSISIILPDLVLWNCVYLDIHLDYYIVFKDIQMLLEKLPKLHEMKVTCNYRLSHGYQWEKLLTEKCSYIQKFQITFICHYRYITRQISDVIQMDFSTLFWLDRKVQITHNEESYSWTVQFEK
ncbi:hypothetical protein I4U23_016404 [Adineta vaga]|nr:hypothetical protein I4U23_016404 [Adineta vaga]